MNKFVRVGAGLVLAIVAGACVAPVAGGPAATNNSSVKSPAVEASPTPAVAGQAVTVADAGEGEAIAVEQLLNATHAKCLSDWEDSILPPTDEQLAAADEQGSGRNARGDVIGSEAAVVAAFDDAILVARQVDGRQLFLRATVDGRLTNVYLLAFPTPAGNMVWSQVGGATAAACS
jgi:hypothetical protein